MESKVHRTILPSSTRWLDHRQTDRQTKSGRVKRYEKSWLWFVLARCLHLPLSVEQVALSFWRRAAPHFSAGRKLWRQMPLDGLWWIVPCFPLPKKLHRHQYIDKDIITLVMKGLFPLNSNKQSVIIVKSLLRDFHKIQTNNYLFFWVATSMRRYNCTQQPLFACCWPLFKLLWMWVRTVTDFLTFCSLVIPCVSMEVNLR